MQALQAALNRVKAAIPEDLVHESDRNAAAEIKALTVTALTEKTTPGLQAKISKLLALQTQSSIITRLSVPGKEADLRAFRSSSGLKASSWLNSGDNRYDTKMLDPDFTVAFALRLSLEPFADVNRDYMCKRCGDLMGNSLYAGNLAQQDAQSATKSSSTRLLGLSESTALTHECVLSHPWSNIADSRRKITARTAGAEQTFLSPTLIALAPTTSSSRTLLLRRPLPLRCERLEQRLTPV